MCGRARCTLKPEEVSRACGNDGSLPTLHTERHRPSFNVSPGSYMPIVRKDDRPGKGAVVHCMKWGLIPSFTKKTEKPDHFRMFNARSESVCEKASFRRLVPNNRCLVAVEGFFEWKKDGSRKQPYYIHFKDHQPLVFAALYDYWENSEGEVFHTFTILTTCCSSALQWLHDRMPVILGSKSSKDAWLNGSPSFKFETILKPYEETDLVWYPVSPEMGKPSFNGPECIKEIQLKPKENPISKFFFKTSENIRESGPEVKVSSEESAKTNLIEGLKEEPVTHETEELVTDFKGHENDDKSKFQIQLKPKENPIPKFFKTSENKHESGPEVEVSSEESAKTNLIGGLKEEPITHETEELVADFKGHENDDKSKFQAILNEGDEKCGTKRSYKQFAMDSELPDTVSKPSPNAVKKKENPKSANDRQPTLLSYFGRS